MNARDKLLGAFDMGLVDFRLVEVIVPIIAEKGDQLMMVNGVCIGVSTAKPVPTAPSEVRLLTAPVQKRRKHRGSRPSQDIRNAATSLLRKHSAVTLDQVVDALQVHRQTANRAMVELVTKGIAKQYKMPNRRMAYALSQLPAADFAAFITNQDALTQTELVS